MQIEFTKYHALGNDFVSIDNRSGDIKLIDNMRMALCTRKTGIGANGILELQHSSDCSFSLLYYNSDGKLASLCGNGCRCSLAFAKKLGIFTENDVIMFDAYDGRHEGGFLAESNEYFISMMDVKLADIKKYDSENYYLNTGSPQHVRFVKGLSEMDVISEGRPLRYNLYGTAGANINFVEVNQEKEIYARTYERGVEEEALACGTGATGIALIMWLYHQQQKSELVQTKNHQYSIHMGGGKLTISFSFDGETFSHIRLIGEAVHVFDGKVTIPWAKQ